MARAPLDPFYQEQNRTSKRFSYRWFASQAGMWQTPIIREIVTIRDFGDDWVALAGPCIRRCHPLTRVRRSRQTLLELGHIEKRAEGGYRQTKQGMAADEALTSMSVRVFHGHMLEHAKRALHELGKHERKQSSLIMGLSPGAHGRAGTSISTKCPPYLTFPVIRLTF